jgi:hypothetical protein
MATDDFDGSFNKVAVLSITPPLGGPAMVDIQGIETLTLPVRQHKKDTWPVISGVRAGKEQQALCSEQAATIEGTLTYELSRYLELDALHGINGCDIVLQASDGLIFAATGGLEKLSAPKMEDSKHGTSDFTFAVNAGWTPADSGGAILTVGLYTVTMANGTKDINLSACGAGGIVNLNGKQITQIYLKAPTTNNAAVTVAEAVATGYPIKDSAVLEPGDEQLITIATGNQIEIETGTNDLLTVSGTGTDTLQVSFKAVASA